MTRRSSDTIESLRARDRQSFEAQTFTHGNCLLWTGRQHADGYGLFYSSEFKYLNALAKVSGGMPVRAQVRATRFAFYMAFDAMPGPGIGVCHRCDVPLCVNLDHLFLGDQGQNIRDMVSKGRHWLHQPGAADRLRGEANPHSAFSEADVVAIWAKRSRGVYITHLAEEYGVSATAIWQTLTGKSWSHLYQPLFAKYGNLARRMSPIHD